MQIVDLHQVRESFVEAAYGFVQGDPMSRPCGFRTPNESAIAIRML
jgi:hypothetical protein